MRVTLFTDVRALARSERELDLPKLAELITATAAPAKHDLPLLKLATFGDVRTPNRSLRHDANLLKVYGVECDYDGEVVTFEEATECVKEAAVQGILYTSPSHTPAKPRWRALFPLVGPILPAQRAHLADRANAIFGGILAKETWTLSQAFYFGRALANEHFSLVIFTEGNCLDQFENAPAQSYGAETDDTPPNIDSPSSFEDLSARLKRVIKSGDIVKHNFKSRSHMVFYVACALVRAGWDDESIIALLLNADYPVTIHVREHANPRVYARKQARDARAKAQEDWERNHTGQISSYSQRNINRALTEIGAKFHRDVFSQRNYINGVGPLCEIDDYQISKLRLNIDRRFNFLPAKDLFYDVIEDLSFNHEIHPVRERLRALQPTWDGVCRIGRPADPAAGDRGVPSWLTTYGGAVDTDLTRRVGRLVLIAAVRRVRQPGCDFQEMLVLVNPQQGTNKTGAVKLLAMDPEWYTDSLPLHANDQKVIEQLKGKWLVECGELQGMKQADVEQLKGFLTRQVDRARPAYGRLVVHAARQCIFIGTTNTTAFLRDIQNRRYWPVDVDRFDLERLRDDVEMLWAEAASVEAGGEPIKLESVFWNEAAEIQWEHRQTEPWADLLAETLRDLCGKITGTDAWKIIGKPGGQRTPVDHERLGSALRELGFDRKKARVYGRVGNCYARGTLDEQQRQIYVYVDPTAPGVIYAGHDPNADIEPMEPDADIDPNFDPRPPLLRI